MHLLLWYDAKKTGNWTCRTKMTVNGAVSDTMMLIQLQHCMVVDLKAAPTVMLCTRKGARSVFSCALCSMCLMYRHVGLPTIEKPVPLPRTWSAFFFHKHTWNSIIGLVFSWVYQAIGMACWLAIDKLMNAVQKPFGALQAWLKHTSLCFLLQVVWLFQ